MASSKKYNRFDAYLLKGKFRRSGFENWRYVFTGISKATGEQKTFFIELYYVNPQISPGEAVIAQKTRSKISDSELQYALAGTLAAKEAVEDEKFVPSYVLLKAGFLGENSRLFNCFYPAEKLSFVKSEQSFKLENCFFGKDFLSGKVEVTAEELLKKPELLCSAGSMKWNLHFEKTVESGPLFKSSRNVWIPLGAKTVFAGIVELNGTEYTVVPRSSSGYVSKGWGERPCENFFHISSSNLTSMIYGKSLGKSCSCVEGEFEKKLTGFIQIEDRRMILSGKGLFNKYTEIHSCSQMPVDADGEKLHWCVSFHKKKLVIDIDIYCKTSRMLVRNYELPEGGRTLLVICGGGTGFGEIKVFKKVKNNLELLEHASVMDALCDFGSVDGTEGQV